VPCDECGRCVAVPRVRRDAHGVHGEVPGVARGGGEAARGADQDGARKSAACEAGDEGAVGWG